MKKIIAAAILATIIIGCSSGPTEGTIIDKEYEEGEWERHAVNKCTGTGKKRKCKTVNEEKWDDPDWEIQIEDKKGNKAWIDVSESTYDDLAIGDHYKG